MEVKITENNQEITASFIGRLDTPAAAEVNNSIQPLLEKADRRIILECKEMSYISSSGLRIFLSIRKAAAAKGGKVIVRDICPDIRQVFMMTGFLNLFEIENS